MCNGLKNWGTADLSMVGATTSALTRESLQRAIDSIPKKSDDLWDTIVIRKDKWKKVKEHYDIKDLHINTCFESIFGIKIYTYNTEEEYLQIINHLKLYGVKFRVII